VLRDRLERVRQRIQHACQRSGRQPSTVTLVGVTKGVAPDAIREAVALGLTDLGENRVQEARDKIPQIADEDQQVRWHLIGHLQRNKARHAVELFSCIHSVDSTGLIEEMERQAAQRRPQPLDVLLQVNVGGEATKFGCRPEEAAGLARAAQACPHLRFGGLMTLAPFSDDPEQARPHFRRLRGLRDEVAAACAVPAASLKLSMGMSQDFEVAIEEGADLVRVGTAIFGARA
jgi:pyridoxal phosphate enzyme (YggS family)